MLLYTIIIIVLQIKTRLCFMRIYKRDHCFKRIVFSTSLPVNENKSMILNIMIKNVATQSLPSPEFFMGV